MRSRPVCVVLVNRALLLLLSGCGGASPETRARQTRTAERGTRTPTPWTPPRAISMTAEAFLPVAPRPLVVGTVSASSGRAMTEPELTKEMIAAAMAKAEARACVGSDRCYALPSDVESARSRCTPKGRCRVGLVVGGGGRQSYDVWLEVSTGLVKLIPQVHV